MAEHAPFSKTLFSKDETANPVKDSVTGEVLCGSRVFQSQEEVDAAGGNAVWKATPQEAAQAQPPPPPPTPMPEDEGGSTPRSRR